MKNNTNQPVEAAGMDACSHHPDRIAELTKKLAEAENCIETDAKQISQLTAKVARLLEALDWIVKRPSAASENIARNAIADNTYPSPKVMVGDKE